jgi:hypothetical protein
MEKQGRLLPSRVQCGTARHLPSSSARQRARLCSVWAGSGHCIRAPNGEQEGVVRSGLSPQGVRPVVLFSPGMFFRGGPLSSVLVCGRDSTCREAGAPRRKQVSAVLIWALFSVYSRSLCSRHAAERPIRLCGEQPSRRVNGTGVHRWITTLNWDFSGLTCDINHKVPGRNSGFA